MDKVIVNGRECGEFVRPYDVIVKGEVKQVGHVLEHELILPDGRCAAAPTAFKTMEELELARVATRRKHQRSLQELVDHEAAKQAKESA